MQKGKQTIEWWRVGVKYEDQGYIKCIIRGKHPRSYNNRLIAFKDTKPCTTEWLKEQGLFSLKKRRSRRDLTTFYSYRRL